MADFDLGAILNDPTFQTGLGMIGTNQALGPAFQQAAQAAQANKAAQQQNQLRALQLQQLQARANFNPSQYLLSNEAQNASPQAAGPATQAALAAQQGPAGAQIASNTRTPYEQPQGTLGNVDIQGMLGAGLRAGMSPEEVQGMAGVIDPMTAIRMRNMTQPSLVVGPQDTLVNPGLAMNAAIGQGGQSGSAQAPQGGVAAGALYTNPNPPANSDAAQLGYMTKYRDQFPVGSNSYNMADAALNKMSGIVQQKQENSKTYGDPDANEANARQIAAGKAPPITGRALTTPVGAAIMQRAYQINPKFNGTEFATAEKASKDFATGTQGDQVRTFGVSSNHMGTLRQQAVALGNGNTPAFNQLANAWAKQTGKPAPTNFEAVRNLAVAETVNAITAGGGTQAERDQAQADLAGANSPLQLTGVIDRYQSMMADKRAGLKQQYETSTNRNDFDQKFPMPAPPAAPKIAPNDALAELKRRGVIQ